MGTFTDEIISLVLKKPGMTAVEISKALRIDVSTVSSTLSKAVKKSYLSRTLNTRGTWIYSEVSEPSTGDGYED